MKVVIQTIRMQLPFFVVYGFLSLINLKTKLAVTASFLPTPSKHPWMKAIPSILEQNHDKLMAFQFTNNEQSRLLQFYIPESMVQLYGLSVHHAYIVQRFLFVFLAFCCFHLYLKKWLDDKGAMLGVCFLAAIMPLTYYNHLQESAPLLMLLFLLGLWALREERYGWFTAILFVGALNNETILVLPAVIVFHKFTTLREVWKPFLRSVATAIPAFAAFGTIRYITRDRPHLGGAWHLPDNLQGLWQSIQLAPWDYYRAYYLFLFFFFNAFWVYAFVRLREKPLFLRRASLIVPIFLGIHMLTGIVLEVRQMIPLASLIIPMGLLTLFPPSHQEATSQESTTTSEP